MKIAFFGTPAFAVPVLQSAIASGHEVVLAVSQPDRPSGRKQELLPTPVKEEAMKHGIPVLQPLKVKSQDFLEQYKNFSPEINIVAAFGQIMPDELLYFPKHHSVNIHASLLPRYRGASPINRAVINGDTVTGVSYQMMEAKLDAGDIIYSAELPINDSDTSETLFGSLSALAASTLPHVLKLISEEKAVRVKQDESTATYAGLLKKEDAAINFNLPAKNISNLVRGLLPWPCAHCTLEGKKLKIYTAIPFDFAPSSAAGTITQAVKPLGITVSCAGSSLLIKELAPEGRKRMSAWDFYNGRKDIIGKTLA
jgi:methionyl-tRNA formyltransferase